MLVVHSLLMAQQLSSFLIQLVTLLMLISAYFILVNPAIRSVLAISSLGFISGVFIYIVLMPTIIPLLISGMPQSINVYAVSKDNNSNTDDEASTGKSLIAVSILFMTADPTDASRLRLGEEAREIQEKLHLAKFRDRFELHQRMSVRPTDISQALLDIQPQIVHFSGHGASSGALCFENQIGEIQPIQPDALSGLFEQFSRQVNCVVLNACYSETQAIAIGKHIDCVVGMNQAIGDKAAISFSIGFYQALGAGRTIEEAYKLGCVQIRLQGIPEHLTPILIKQAAAQPPRPADLLRKERGAND